MKIAKILSTCFKRGRVREKTVLAGDPPGYFSHSQNFTSVADVIKLLNYQIEMETKYPPGLDRDLIIVNSDVGSVEGNLFIKNLTLYLEGDNASMHNIINMNPKGAFK